VVAVDTNVIVRLLVNDDPKQYEKSRAAFSSKQIFIPDTVILETEWVLRYAYEFSSNEICKGLKKLLGLENVRVSNQNAIADAIRWHESGLDFADAFHLALSQEQEILKSFDKKFIKKSKELSKCRVELP
jgi:predicted nucleic-acid-binding protein